MREIKKRTVRAAVCATLLSGWAATAAADDITYTFSGYGTLGGTFTSNSLYSYHHDQGEPQGASNQFDVALESRLGLQAVVDFGSGFSVTAQELARERVAGDFALGTEWLYLQYAPDSAWKVRLGRVVLPVFLLSDSRNVGYASSWFRAPNDVYGSLLFQHLDGAQALWHVNEGPVGLGLEACYGSIKEQVLSAGVQYSTTVKDAYNVAATLEYGDLLFRVARTSLNIPESLPFSPTYIVNYLLRDKYTSVGLQYDNGKAVVLSEWVRSSQNLVPGLTIPASASSQWYVAGGWRFGKLTPLLSYSAYKPKQSLVVPADASYGSWSASLRYDVVRNIALKAQVTRAQAGDDQYWVIPNPASSARINVYSLGADFVF